MGIGTFWAQNIIQEKLTNFTKILNYIKYSCIISCAKMYRYSNNIYILQDKSTYFGLRVLTNFDLGVSKHCVPKNHTKKSEKFIKIFKLYQVFMHNFWSQNVPMPPIVHYWLILKVFCLLLTLFNFIRKHWI